MDYEQVSSHQAVSPPSNHKPSNVRKLLHPTGKTIHARSGNGIGPDFFGTRSPSLGESGASLRRGDERVPVETERSSLQVSRVCSTYEPQRERRKPSFQREPSFFL